YLPVPVLQLLVIIWIALTHQVVILLQVVLPASGSILYQGAFVVLKSIKKIAVRLWSSKDETSLLLFYFQSQNL
ncbi:MAG: hypothetical protein M3449_01100, partial [Acidobacteriota bacterium]|nr:hypothetical protein [Acidobacteriota bacterium]